MLAVTEVDVNAVERFVFRKGPLPMDEPLEAIEMCLTTAIELRTYCDYEDAAVKIRDGIRKLRHERMAS